MVGKVTDLREPADASSFVSHMGVDMRIGSTAKVVRRKSQVRLGNYLAAASSGGDVAGVTSSW